jgi:hypothetical protein
MSQKTIELPLDPRQTLLKLGEAGLMRPQQLPHAGLDGPNDREAEQKAKDNEIPH